MEIRHGYDEQALQLREGVFCGALNWLLGPYPYIGVPVSSSYLVSSTDVRSALR